MMTNNIKACSSKR